MKLLFIFDNYSNTYDWKTKINVVKRWILYNINYLLMKNNLEKIKIVKTYPVISYLTLSTGIEDNFKEIIKFFDEIILKYDKTYKVESFLKCIENISQDYDYDHIYVLTCFANFSDYECINIKKNKQKINDTPPCWPGEETNSVVILENEETKPEENTEKYVPPDFLKVFEQNTSICINLLNFCHLSNNIIKNSFSKSNIPLLVNLANSIVEFTIGYSEFRKIYDNLYTIHKFINNNIIFKYSEEEIESLLNNTKIENLENLFLLNLQLVEYKILNKNNNYNLFFKILLTYYERINSNFIKYCFNSIRNLILFEKGFIIEKEFKINKFNKIFDFYKLIYPRILKHNFFNIKNNNKKNLVKLNENFNISQIDYNNSFTLNYSDEIDKSTSFLFSNTTFTTWFEEFNEHNIFGILLYYNIPKNTSFNIFNACDNILNDFPCTYVSNINNNFISMYDYYELFLAEINDKNNSLLNNETGSLNLKDFYITDNIYGNSNIMVPLYICKEHWELCKIFWNYHISLCHNCVEGQYNKKMDNIYFYILLKNFNEILRLKELININNIRLLFYIIRTCLQICIDNKYSLSIQKNYKTSYDELIKSESKEKFEKNFEEYLIRCLQFILCSKYDNLQNDFNTIKNIYIKLLIELKFSYLKDKEKKDYDELESNGKKELENYLLPFLILENTLINLSIIIINIFEIINFNKFLKYIDSKYGLIQEYKIKSIETEKNIDKQEGETTDDKLTCEKIAEIIKTKTISEKFTIDLTNYIS